MENRILKDLLKIVSSGGGIRINGADIETADLTQIAFTAKNAEASVYIFGMKNRSTVDIVEIANTGKGYVIFES